MADQAPSPYDLNAQGWKRRKSDDAKSYRVAGEAVSDAVGEEFGRLIAERDRLRAGIPVAVERAWLIVPPWNTRPTREQLADAIESAFRVSPSQEAGTP